MSTYIGIDGGGTHARAVVVDDDGHELARHSAGAGIVDPREPARAADVVAQLVRSALERAAAPPPTRVLCCGLAGAGREEERAAVHAALADMSVAERVIIIGDAEAAMYDAFGDRHGVLLIAGTGSIAWARGAAGVVRVGGWGVLLGDEGSGYDIGLQALRAVARAHDARAPDTHLTHDISRSCDVAHTEQLVAWAGRAAKADIAALAPIVLAAAEAGDHAALHIRAHAVAELAALVRAAAQRAHLRAPEIVCMGGLLRNAPLRSLLDAELRLQLPGTNVADRTVDAARGAALLALRAHPRD